MSLSHTRAPFLPRQTGGAIPDAPAPTTTTFFHVEIDFHTVPPCNFPADRGAGAVYHIFLLCWKSLPFSGRLASWK
jgi:hypothetical protein